MRYSVQWHGNGNCCEYGVFDTRDQAMQYMADQGWLTDSSMSVVKRPDDYVDMYEENLRRG